MIIIIFQKKESIIKEDGLQNTVQYRPPYNTPETFALDKLS